MLQHRCSCMRHVSQHEGTITGSMSALAVSSKWGRSWRYQLMEAVVHQWLPACPWHTDLALQIDFLLLCFQRCLWYQSSSSFKSLFLSIPLGSTGCQGAAQNQRCLPNTGLLWLLVSGGGRVGWETVSYLEFPVWVLGRLLEIPILITNFLFQLRCLPDKTQYQMCHKLLPAILLLWSSLQ